MDTETEEQEEGFAVIESDRVIVSSCYDSDTMTVQLSVEFTGIEMLDSNQMPWLAVGYREDEDCKMNPSNGDDSEIILLSHPSPGANYQADLTALPSAARRFDESAIASISASSTPLAQDPLFSEVYVFAPAISDNAAIERSFESTSPDSVTLRFKQSMNAAPDAMNLMYAIGSSPEMQFHASRGCFQVVDFPKCPSSDTMSEEEGSSTTGANATTSAAFSVATAASILASGVVAVFLL
jgi:hypothetical protein